MVTAETLIVVLGDQLSMSLSSLQRAQKDKSVVLLVEVAEEVGYARHHKKKIAFLFSAMRHFAEELRADGWRVDYVELDDKDNAGSFTGEVERALARHGMRHLLITHPGEYRVLQMALDWRARLNADVEILGDTRFICSRKHFTAWAKDRKQLTMEFFYREMRRKTCLLMDGDKPAGGRWNYDSQNRKPLSGDGSIAIPSPLKVRPDAITNAVLDLVETHCEDWFGDLKPFWFGVTRTDAEKALQMFLAEALPHFGTYQDAMARDERFLFHSVLSLYINSGLLDPLAVCRQVEVEYLAGRVPLNAAEGFIRQIIGWREYVRGVYWLKMPDYVEMNALGATRDLPWFYWSGETEMACMAQCIGQTMTEGYAHHIQRLMITGNFALLAGIDPRQAHEWYLAVYVDAYEWVELPNTLGMSQFADGGLLGSKPYAASGNYINRMSDYCPGCRYDVKEKTGEDACPFNYLYWDFIARNEHHFAGNPRMIQTCRSYAAMDVGKKAAIASSSEKFLGALKSTPDGY